MTKLVKLDAASMQSLGVRRQEHVTHVDSRGSMGILFEHSFETLDHSVTWKRSHSLAGVGRGLHFQTAEYPITKIINLDVGDLIEFLYFPDGDSKQLFYFEYSASHGHSYVIPPHLAHGFVALTDARFSYITLGQYMPSRERVYNFLPSACALLGLAEPTLSEKDRASAELDLQGKSL
jgi:dTDP-4-dehydrorhamnose 3,5-epimerase-like enzyme